MRSHGHLAIKGGPLIRVLNRQPRNGFLRAVRMEPVGLQTCTGKIVHGAMEFTGQVVHLQVTSIKHCLGHLVIELFLLVVQRLLGILPRL